MRIAIDISTLLNFGIGIVSARYISNLLKNLFQIDKQNTYVLFARYFNEEHLHILAEFKKDYPDCRLEERLFKTTEEKLARWDRFSFPPLEARGLHADVFHFPDYLLAPLFSKNTVLTIHDLSFYSVPQFNFEWFVKKYQKVVKKNALKAKLLIADSESTKEDIIRHLAIAEDKIHAIHLGPDLIFKKLQERQKDRALIKKMGIHKRFLLSVGTIEPRKNYPNLIKTFNQIRQKVNLSCVLCGKTGWKSEETFLEWEKSPYKDDIKFVGAVSDQALLQLYNQAELLFYPSYFEGFGFPLVEAMACGLPVIASDTSSITEVVMDKKLLFDPEDLEGFSRKIVSVLKDPLFKKELSQKSIQNAKKFSLEKMAQETLSVYYRVLTK